MMDTHAKAELLAKRPYLIKISVEETTDDQSIYFAQAPGLEGCFGQGATHEQALEDLRLAMVDFIESLLEDNLPVPEPAKLNSTMGTEATGFTFIVQGKKLSPKRTEIPVDAYVLLAQVG